MRDTQRNRAIRLDGEKCARARARRGFSRERLAEASRGGLSVATLKRVEKGAAVYLDTAHRLATLLDLSVEELMSSANTPASATGTADRASRPATIAVLPFEVFGTDWESGYFGDGLVEDLITRIGRLWFPVISRASSFHFAGQRPEPQTLRAELGADYVVDGSVRRAGDRIRVTARVTDTKTGLQLWANFFDRSYEDVFKLEDTLVSTIVAQVGGAILEKEHHDRIHRDPADLTAWDLALQGSWHFHRGTRDANGRARSLLEEALRREPALPLAWYSLAMTHQRAIVNQWSADPGGSLHELKQVCAAFASHHPGESGLHIAMAYCDVYAGDRTSAIGRLREAIEIDPNAAQAYVLYGQALAMEKQPDEAIEQLEVALRLSPRDSDLWRIQTAVALSHFVAERPEEMLHWAQLAVLAAPHAPFPYGTLAVAHAYIGNVGEASAAVRRLLEIEPKTSVRGLEAIVASTRPDIVARYVACLRRAGVPA